MPPDEYRCLGDGLQITSVLSSLTPQRTRLNVLCIGLVIPKDVEYVYQHSEGSLVSVDTYLVPIEDWRDTSLWPTSEKESQIRLDAA